MLRRHRNFTQSVLFLHNTIFSLKPAIPKTINMLRFAFLLAAAGLSAGLHAQQPPASAPYKNPKAPIAERGKDLIQRMTFQERGGQLHELDGGEFRGPGLNDKG